MSLWLYINNTYVGNKHTDVPCVIFMCYFGNLKTSVTREDNLPRRFRPAGDENARPLVTRVPALCPTLSVAGVMLSARTTAFASN